jgi:hypothetical protein
MLYQRERRKGGGGGGREGGLTSFRAERSVGLDG